MRKDELLYTVMMQIGLAVAGVIAIVALVDWVRGDSEDKFRRRK